MILHVRGSNAVIVLCIDYEKSIIERKEKKFIIPQVRIVNVNDDQIERIVTDIYEDYEQEYLHRLLNLPERSF
jgi:hypothetical protein